MPQGPPSPPLPTIESICAIINDVPPSGRVLAAYQKAQVNMTGQGTWNKSLHSMTVGGKIKRSVSQSTVRFKSSQKLKKTDLYLKTLETDPYGRYRLRLHGCELRENGSRDAEHLLRRSQRGGRAQLGLADVQRVRIFPKLGCERRLPGAAY